MWRAYTRRWRQRDSLKIHMSASLLITEVRSCTPIRCIYMYIYIHIYKICMQTPWGVMEAYSRSFTKLMKRRSVEYFPLSLSLLISPSLSPLFLSLFISISLPSSLNLDSPPFYNFQSFIWREVSKWCALESCRCEPSFLCTDASYTYAYIYIYIYICKYLYRLYISIYVNIYI
jgi:hypothetical protein